MAAPEQAAPEQQADSAAVHPRETPALRRVLTLPLLTLYGLGVTIGAGIYVLVGVTAAKAGIYAPLTFCIAALVVAFTCLTYAELSTRFPVSAGEAEYVQVAFGSRLLASLAGLLLVVSGTVSSAAISVGAASYLKLFLSVPDAYLIIGLVLLLGAIACWGIFESVFLAALFTVIEISGLALVVWTGTAAIDDFSTVWKAYTPDLDLATWTGIASGSLLAFFAFVGFEDMVNVAEEVDHPERTMPRAIFLTLVIATLMYLAVVTTMVTAVPLDVLSASSAPLALLFKDKPPLLSSTFNIIAIVATVNGILIQIIMVARVTYGLSRQGNLPAFLSYVHPRLRTPVIATMCIAIIVAALAVATPISRLAEATSVAVLTVFVMVNAALIALRRGSAPTAAGEYFKAPAWAPFAGLATSLMLLASSAL
ncbi:MAG: amino acid permease [Hyphomicrobiales bacterium]|nr:amino acid permease [Hyphomicrobiales bacterium]